MTIQLCFSTNCYADEAILKSQLREVRRERDEILYIKEGIEIKYISCHNPEKAEESLFIVRSFLGDNYENCYDANESNIMAIKEAIAEKADMLFLLNQEITAEIQEELNLFVSSKIEDGGSINIEVSDAEVIAYMLA